MENNNIVFLTSSHSSLDDRIFYHLARSLSQIFKVTIISSTENIVKTIGNVSIIGNNKYDFDKRKKIEFFFDSLKQSNPQLIICSEPLPILAAYKYQKKFRKKVKIIYDITEWYPSKKNLENLSFLKRLITFFKLLLFNIYASSKCNYFIFGEYYKSLPYRILFPQKKWTIIGYYTDIIYINYKESKLTPGKICLGYTGKISVEKGIANFFDVAIALKRKRPNLSVKLKIIGWCLSDSDKNIFDTLCQQSKNIEIEILDKQDCKSSEQSLPVKV